MSFFFFFFFFFFLLIADIGRLTFIFFPASLAGPSHVRRLLGGAICWSPFTVPSRAGSTESQIKRQHDPFLKALARQRKAANLSRQQKLTEQRESSLGDPVKSEPTPFIRSLEAVRKGVVTEESKPRLNYLLADGDVAEAYKKSYELTSPLENPNRETADPQAEAEAAASHQAQHGAAEEAINRIVSLRNGNTKDRVRVNIARCIDTFGRHNTDQFLETGILAAKPAAVPRGQRLGKDTGSSEVQIAILTEKILNLTRHLDSTNKDKHNKRNLQLLVHKRQKMVKYLRRQDKGGPRWQHVMKLLGLPEASWKGEISL